MRCGALLPSGIAWEDPRYGNVVVRFLRSLRDLLRRPQIAFPGPPRVAPSLRFAALSGLSIGLVGALGAAVVIGESESARGLGVAWFSESPLSKVAAFLVVIAAAVVVSLAFAAATSISFGAGLLGVGRSRGVLRISLRTASYAQGLALLSFAVPLTLSALRVGVGDGALLALTTRVVWLLSSLFWLAVTTRVFFWAGRGIGLSSPRAAAASAGPLLFSFPITVLVFDAHLDPLVDQLSVVI